MEKAHRSLQVGAVLAVEYSLAPSDRTCHAEPPDGRVFRQVGLHQKRAVLKLLEAKLLPLGSVRDAVVRGPSPDKILAQASGLH